MKNRNAPITTWITIFALLLSMCAGLTLSQRTAAQSEKPNPEQSALQYPSLSKYATDLTLLALQGKLPRTNERAADVDRVIASLTRTERTPVLVGESDLDRNIVARGVALKIASGDVPDELRTARVFSLRIDKLAEGAGTEAEFSRRVQSVFAEVAQSADHVVLFVDQLQDYIGMRASAGTSAAVREAIEKNHLSIVAGASTKDYASYIASSAEVAKLFEPLSIDSADDSSSSAIADATDNRRSPINEEFVGEKISSDMSELIKSAGRHGRVGAILQVNDVNSKEVRALLAENGVLVGDRMASLGAVKVDLPVQAIEALMKSDATNYISPDVEVRSFGHVTATSGADQIRNDPGLIGSLLGGTAIDGTGVTIAIIDSGMDLSHVAFQPSGRLKFKKDFTPENKPDKDYYGHGSHVASLAAGNYTNGTGTSYQGVAYHAT